MNELILFYGEVCCSVLWYNFSVFLLFVSSNKSNQCACEDESEQCEYKDFSKKKKSNVFLVIKG